MLGLGNVLCGDDGFGCFVAQLLQENWQFSDQCEIADAGTQGQLLYGAVEQASRLLLVDAVDFGLEPGSLVMRSQAEIPAWLAKGKLSAHQCSFAEVLGLAALRDALPAEIRLIGLQAEVVEFGARMSRSARAAIAPAISMVQDCLAEWGVRAVPCKKLPLGAAAELRAAFLDVTEG